MEAVGLKQEMDRLKLQMPGKRVLAAADFLNANDVQGAVFR